MPAIADWLIVFAYLVFLFVLGFRGAKLSRSTSEEFILGGRELFKNCRTPDILADAAYEILTTENCALTGQALVDEVFLKQRGVKDFNRYAYDPSQAENLLPDFFLEESEAAYARQQNPPTEGAI